MLTAAINVNEFSKQHPRDAGFAGAVAMALNLNAAANERGSSKSAPAAAAKPKKTAREEFRALVSEKLDARLTERRRFRHNAQLTSGDVLRAQADVHKEYPALRQRMIDEANAGKAGYGMARRASA